MTFQGFTPPATITNTTLGLDHYDTIIGNILSSVKAAIPFTVSVDANYTFPVAAIVQAGTGTCYADQGNVRIDDVGPAGAPL